MTPLGSKRNIKYIDKSFLITLGTATRWSLDVCIRMQCVISMRIVFTLTLCIYTTYKAFVFVSVVLSICASLKKKMHPFPFLIAMVWSEQGFYYLHVSTSQHLNIGSGSRNTIQIYVSPVRIECTATRTILWMCAMHYCFRCSMHCSQWYLKLKLN